MLVEEVTHPIHQEKARFCVQRQSRSARVLGSGRDKGSLMKRSTAFVSFFACCTGCLFELSPAAAQSASIASSQASQAQGGPQTVWVRDPRSGRLQQRVVQPLSVTTATLPPSAQAGSGNANSGGTSSAVAAQPVSATPQTANAGQASQQSTVSQSTAVSQHSTAGWQASPGHAGSHVGWGQVGSAYVAGPVTPMQTRPLIARVPILAPEQGLAWQPGTLTNSATTMLRSIVRPQAGYYPPNAAAYPNAYSGAYAAPLNVATGPAGTAGRDAGQLGMQPTVVR